MKFVINSFLLLFLFSCNGSGGDSASSSPVQSVLPDGYFAYSNGTTYGIHGQVSNSGTTYLITHYDIANNRYQIESGTISYNGNVLTFTILASAPANCMSGNASWDFSFNDSSVTLVSQLQNITITAVRVNYGVSSFVSAGATQFCWL
jgi:hypothetical protein